MTRFTILCGNQRNAGQPWRETPPSRRRVGRGPP